MRYLALITFAALAILTTNVSCKKKKPREHFTIEEGVIQKQGFTTYMYGTHLLVQDDTHQLVLKSNTRNLDNYLNKKVRITATRTDKTPENGPPLYNVSAIKKIP